MFANHPGICLGYRLSTPGGDIVYMPDHEAYERCEIERQKAERMASPDGLAYARIQDEKVSISSADADLVIAGFTIRRDRIPITPRLGAHLRGMTPSSWRCEPAPSGFALFHHDPDHTDEKIADHGRSESEC